MPETVSRLVAAAVAGLLATACAARLAAADNLASEQDFGLIERGRYLTTVADCAACHTDPASNDLFAGGRPIETPFGKVVSPNITPDLETGIGTWTDAQFDAAVRQGRDPDGARLYPAMPFPYYARMTAEDVRAIRAYLRTVAPVHHPVESNQLPFPYDIRAGMALWDALYFEPGTFKPDPHKSAQWNRGAYLVRGPGHCGACHTPKSVLGGDEKHQALQGYSIQGWFAPNITNDLALGLGRWSVQDVQTYLKSGHNRFAGASGPMAEEVADSSSRMSDADLQSIAVYLKDQPGEKTSAKPLAASDPQMVAGAAIYSDLCSACHAQDGSGVAYLVPNLSLASSVSSREPTSLLRVVIHGARTVGTPTEPTAPAMPAFGWQLTDAQIAAVTTYVRNSWGHAAPALSASDVHKRRSLDSGG
ncbi:MAG: c-type cytochrome [Gammaproteobacteria bacterium]|nr:c-type cytochrome [Gammaproteobacteria bacterium]